MTFLRLTAMLLVLVTVLAFTPFGAAAASDNGFTYTVNEDGKTVTVTGYNGNSTDVVIPASIGGKTVTAIGRLAFEKRKYLYSVTLPAGLVEISPEAFRFCPNFTRFIVDGNNKTFCSVNGVVFTKDKKTLVRYPSGKTDLTYAVPKGVTALSHLAFSTNAVLTGVTFPASLTEVGDSVFYFCTALKEAEFPQTVLRVGTGAFYNCTSLTRAVFHNSDTAIGDGAFAECPDLTIYGHFGSSAMWYSNNFRVPFKNLDEPEPDPGPYEYRADDAMGLTVAGYTGRQSVLEVVESFDGCSVTAIGPRAFAGMDFLACVTLPESTGYICEGAFYGCAGLTQVVMPANTITLIEDKAFMNCSSLASIRIPGYGEIRGDDVFTGCRPGFVIFCQEDSPALQYAKDHGIAYGICNYTNQELADLVESSLFDVSRCTQETAAAFTAARDEALALLREGVEVRRTVRAALEALSAARDALKPDPDCFGDVDGESGVTSTDARLTLQVSVGKLPGAALRFVYAADVDGDGSVTSTDARLILQYSVKKIDSFPARAVV